MKNMKKFGLILFSVLAIFILVGCKKDEPVSNPDPVPTPSANEVKITFDSAGGSEVSEMIVKKGSTATLPTPTKDGYRFIGWFTEDMERISKSYEFNENLLLKAQWIAVSDGPSGE